MKTNELRSVKCVVGVPGTELAFNATVEKYSATDDWIEFTQVAGPALSREEFLALLPKLTKLARKAGK